MKVPMLITFRIIDSEDDHQVFAYGYYSLIYSSKIAPPLGEAHVQELKDRILKMAYGSYYQSDYHKAGAILPSTLEVDFDLSDVYVPKAVKLPHEKIWSVIYVDQDDNRDVATFSYNFTGVATAEEVLEILNKLIASSLPEEVSPIHVIELVS